MTRLILTTDDSGAGSLKDAGLADIVIPFGFLGTAALRCGTCNVVGAAFHTTPLALIGWTFNLRVISKR